MNCIALVSMAILGAALGDQHPWELEIGPMPVEQACAPQTLRSYATIHSIGFEWSISGDANHNATCNVQYRKQGTKQWNEALPLFRVDYAWWYHESHAEERANMLAGSILFLDPGTTYEVKLRLSDPDGGEATKTLSIDTKPVPAYQAPPSEYHVEPGDGGGSGASDDPFQGIEAAQAKAKPGDVFVLHDGNYGSAAFTESGEPGSYIVWKNAEGAAPTFSAVDVSGSHLWFEGLTFKRNERSDGLKAVGSPRDVVVKRNTFDGFHYSIRLSEASAAWYIADNHITGDNETDIEPPEAFSGEGVELNHSSHHTVCHNRITRVADGISYPGRNCDLFGNDIFDVSDDGIEPDYGWSNNRIWGNRIYNYQFHALSFQPMYCGPWYFIRNQVIGKSIFKFRVQDRFALVNNTFVSWHPFGSGRSQHLLTSLSRNNLFIKARSAGPVWSATDCTQPQYCLPNVYTPTWKTDVDYDGFDWADADIPFIWDNSDRYENLESFAEAVGIEQHGIQVKKEDIFAQYDVPAEPSPVEPQVLTLKPDSAAIDAGDTLPNIHQEYRGDAPDLGAHEHGTSPPVYGPREN